MKHKIHVPQKYDELKVNNCAGLMIIKVIEQKLFD